MYFVGHKDLPSMPTLRAVTKQSPGWFVAAVCIVAVMPSVPALPYGLTDSGRDESQVNNPNQLTIFQLRNKSLMN